jgi:hypothetical protein
MRKIGIIAVLSLMALALAAVPALAANPHFVRGTPDCEQNGQTITCTGSVAGLGNQDVKVVVSALGTADVVCINPGGKRAPGQDTTVSASGSQIIEDPKNGRINFSVTTTAPKDPTPQEAGCPNRKWDAQIRNVDFTSVTISIFQPKNAPQPVLSRTFNL